MIDFPVSVIPAAVTYMSKDKAGNITDVSFEFQEDSLPSHGMRAGRITPSNAGLTAIGAFQRRL